MYELLQLPLHNSWYLLNYLKLIIIIDGNNNFSDAGQTQTLRRISWSVKKT